MLTVSCGPEAGRVLAILNVSQGVIKIKRLIAIAALAALTLTGQVAAQNRIIALNGDITEYIYALGAEDQLVAVDATSNWPEAANDLPNVGYAGRLAVESLLMHDPTLVIYNDLASPVEVFEQLEAAGVEVVQLTNEPELATPLTNLSIVASLVGKEERGAELASELQGKLDEAAAAGAALSYTPRVLFLYLGSAQMQFAGGVDVPSNIMIEAAGGIDAGAEAGLVGYQPFTPEALVAAAPDVLLVTERGMNVMGSVEAILEIPGIMQTPAGLMGNVIVFEDNYLLSLGLRTGDALLDLVAELASLD